ncbi:MAG: MATE family efflux transporter [Muribaculaceae bacterium]|nr:MATE family efflux transporter [Muribaculaceae bacterium]
MALKRNSNPATLGTLPIGKLLVQYSVPAIIAMVATSVYNIIDSIFIGRGVGPLALTALAVNLPLMNLVIAFATLVSVGGATISSIFLGQQNVKRATDVVNNVMTMCLVHSVVFGGITMFFLDEILELFGATPETLPLAREFMEIVLYTTPLAYVFIGMNNLMRSTGYPAKAMISALISVVVNVILAPIFIFKLDMGMRGAALATVGGQFCGFIWVLTHFLSKKSFVHFRRDNKWFSWSIIKRMYGIGLSPFLMNVTSCFVVVFLNKALLSASGDSIDGNMAVGAYGILNRVGMFFVMLVFGITQGMQPILGYNFGAMKWSRVKTTLKLGILAGFCITLVGWTLTELLPDKLSGMFTTDETLISIARDGFRLFFICFPLVGVQIIITNFFQSIGKPALSIFLSLTRQLIFLLPLLAVLPRYYGVTGVWASVGCSDFLAFALALVTILVMMKRLSKKYNNPAAE